jgi:hypothetical protein
MSEYVKKVRDGYPHHSSLSTHHFFSLLSFKRNLFKVRHPFESAKTLIDFRVRQSANTLGAEFQR